MPNSAYGLTMAARPFELEDPRIGRSRSLVNQRQEQAIQEDARQNKRRAAAENAMARYYRGEASVNEVAAADPETGYKLAQIENLKADNTRADAAATEATAKAQREVAKITQEAKDKEDHLKLTRSALVLARIDPADMQGRQVALDALLGKGIIDKDDHDSLSQMDPAAFEQHRTVMEGLADPEQFNKFLSDKRAQEEHQTKMAGAPAAARKAIADATKAEQEVNGTVPMTEFQKQTVAQTRENQKAQRDIDLQRLGIERAGLNLRIKENQQKTQGSLGVLSDTQKSLAQKVADGDLTIQQLSRLPDKEAIVAGAIELNPDWSSNTAATKKAFTDPASKQSQNLGTISRIVGHIGRFEKNSTDLGLSPSLLTGVNLTGTAAKTSNDAHAIASELEKLVSGGVGTVAQVKEWQSDLLSSREGIRKAAIDEISQLMGSQFEGMNQTYKAGLGKDLPLDQFATPEGKKWLAKQGINVTGKDDQLLRAVNPKTGERIESTDGGQTWHPLPKQ